MNTDRPEDPTDPAEPADHADRRQRRDAEEIFDEAAIARFALAVEATAPPVDLAACPRLAEAVCALSDVGVSQRVADWWYTTGKACAGLAIDDTQCDTSNAGYATAAVMYARLVLGRRLDDTDSIVDAAKLALAWDAGRRDITLAAPVTDPRAGR